MINCLVFGLHDAIGGIERYMDNYYPYIVSNGVNLDFVSPYPRMAFQDKYISNGSKVIVVPNFKKNPIAYSSSIDRILKKKKYDIIYVNMLSAANIIPFLLAKKNKVKKIIAHAHNNDTPKGFVRKCLHKTNYKIIEKIATDYWACSEEAGKWLFPDIPSNIIKVIPDAIPMDNFLFSNSKRDEVRKKFNISQSDFLFGHVGRFEEQKNHQFLISVFSELCKHNASAKLMLVGEGYLKDEILERVRELGLIDHVIFTGSVLDVVSYYSAMDAFLFPSKFEGFGMAAIEAQATGLQCIVSSVIPRDIDLTGIQYMPLVISQWEKACSLLLRKGSSSIEERKNRHLICSKSRYSVDIWQEQLCDLLKK